MTATAKSWSEALKLGLPRYFTGKPCKAGHTAERDAITGDCCNCKNERQQLRRQSQRAALRAKAQGDGG